MYRAGSTFRHGLLAAAFCLAAVFPAAAREFKVTTISTDHNARQPSVCHSGIVAWYGISTNEGGRVNMHGRDIYVWKDGTARNITADHPNIAGRCEKPDVCGQNVVFMGQYRGSDEGIHVELKHPPMDPSMLQSDDYPTLEEAASDVEAPPEGEEQKLLRHHLTSGQENDVLLYEMDGTVKRITAGSHHFLSPVHSQAGVAFLCARTWPYGYELLAWKTGADEIMQLTTNLYYVLNPYIDENLLVYQAWDGIDYEIYLYDFNTDETKQITNNQFDDTNPIIHNGEIVWVAHPTVQAEVFHYRAGEIRKLSDGSTENSIPSIWDGKVVWHGLDDDGDFEIYYFDGRRTIKLTSNTWDDLNPQINDGLITWVSYIDNWDAEIMVMDLGDNIAVRLTDNDFEDILPQTAAEKVVWQSLRPDGSVIDLAEPTSPRLVQAEE